MNTAAEMERNLTRERTKSAMAVQRPADQNGAVWVRSSLTLVPNESEQAVIAQMKAMRAKGWTLEAVAEELTERRVPTKTKRSTRWTHQAVARILTRSG